MAVRNLSFMALVGFISILFASPSIEAQEQWSFRGGAGIGIPAGDLGNVAGVGPAFSAGISYWLTDRLSVEVGGQAEILRGGDYDAPSQVGREAPDLTLWHYGVNGRVSVTKAARSGWSFEVDAGVGATTFDSDFRIVLNPETEELVTQVSSTYLSVNGGLVLSYSVTTQVDIFADGRGRMVFVDEADMGAFTGLSDGSVEPFGSAVSLPLSVGVRYSW